MSKLDLYSEPYARTGNIAAEGLRNLLGRPELGLFTTMLREAIQNSIDAARVGPPPRVLITYRTLSKAQRKLLAKQIFSQLPLGDDTREAMLSSLAKPDLRVMEICDFGTSGLGGPTSADVAPGPKEEMDFVNFLCNVGSARDVHHGGGTYGYGKTSLYAMSACSTILVDSQTTVGGAPERRFMGCHLGSAYDAEGSTGSRKRYTGRHWWGVTTDQPAVQPATGENAVSMARGLGMPSRNSERTGTTVLILDPRMEANRETEICDQFLDTLLWNFWPRMTASTAPSRRLNASLEIEGRSVDIPPPEEYPPLDLFSEALSKLHDKDAQTQVIKCLRPSKELGRLQIQKGVVANRLASALREGSEVPLQAHHICLMRPVQLVVKYLPGEPFPDKRFEWAGVFICDESDEVESAFARSEPPTHDDWIPDNLPRGNPRTFVNVAMQRLQEQAIKYYSPKVKSFGEDKNTPSLARAANQMGRLLDQSTPTGRSNGGSGGGRPSKKVWISDASCTGLELDPCGFAIAVFEAELRNLGSPESITVLATPKLAIDGGSEDLDALPTHYSADVVEMKLIESVGRHSDGPSLEVGSDFGTIQIRVRTPESAAVSIQLELKHG